MATKNTPSGTDKLSTGALVVGGLALVGAAVFMASKKTPPASKPTAKFVPTSGGIGAVINVTGTLWAPNDNITAVTVGGADAEYYLTVDDIGSLIGTFTVPVIGLGQRMVVITGETSGPFTYTFTVNPAGWVIIGGTTLTVVAASANPTGWVALGGTTLTVVAASANPTGWVALGGTTLMVTATSANPTGWITLGGTTLSVSASVSTVTTVVLHISCDDGLGFVTAMVGGTQVDENGGIIPKNSTVVVEATPWNSNAWRFDHWTDPGNYLTTPQLTAKLVSLVARGDVTLVANFTVLGSNPAQPTPYAPTGDTQWFYVTFMPGYGIIGQWYDLNAFNILQQEMLDGTNYILQVWGPYAPGAATGF